MLKFGTMSGLILGSMVVVLLSLSVVAEAATLQWDRNGQLDVHHYEMYHCNTSPTCDPYPAPPAVGIRLGADVLQPAVVTVKPQLVIPVATSSGRAGVIAVDLVGNRSTESNVIPFRGQPLNAPTGLQQIP